MRKIISLATLFVLTGCLSTPESVTFKNETVGTYSVAAGCDTMMLDTDCSGITGAKLDISISGTPLRVAGGDNGKVVFVMPESTFGTDEAALRKGSSEIEKIFKEKGIKITTKKVMFGSGEVYGVHYVLDQNGYTVLKSFAI